MRVLVVVPTLAERPLKALLNAVARECREATGHECTPLLLHNGAPSQDIAGYCDAAGVLYANHLPRGFSQIRNEAIRRAVAGDFDVLVMIDDDESPSTGWLASLVAPMTQGADVVVGPVTTAWPPGTPSRFVRSALPRSAVNRADGPVDGDLRSGNCAIRMATLGSLRFDDRFNAAGGEDTALFRQLRAAGARCFWAQSAAVAERVDDDRVALAYFARRAFAQGRGLAAIRRLVPRDDDPPPMRLVQSSCVRSARLVWWAIARRRPEHLFEAVCELAFILGFAARQIRPSASRP